MDWGLVTLIVTANAVISGVLSMGAVWFLKRSLLPTHTRHEVRPPPAVAKAKPPKERTAPVQRKRRKSSVREAVPREPEDRASPRRRGLKDFLAPIGGAPGSIGDDQRLAIRKLLGKAAPTLWMSSAQAHAVLCARDYAEAVIDRRRGTRADFTGRSKVVRRLALAILADDRARGFVIDWADGHYADDDTSAPDPLEQDVWSWVQQHATRLIEAEGRLVEAA